MQKKYKELKDLLKQLYPLCEVCNLRPMTDTGHCLYHQHGGIFDSLENCQSNCNVCNTGYGANANSRDQKKKHWAKRCEELGRDHMENWNSQIGKYRREYFE